MNEQDQSDPQQGREAQQQHRDGRDSVKAEQERFARFIQEENERLNRLIRNLYLYLLQFKHYSERDLYDRICQEVAEYFRADSCELYLVRYEERENGEKSESEKSSPPTPDSRDRKRLLIKWLQLVGAYGPARRLLRQQYVRERSRTLYEIPIVEPKVELPGMTIRGFVSENPTRYASAYDFRRGRDEGPLRRESPRQVVWYQDGLYNSCRCSLMVPLVREGKESEKNGGTRYYRKIGLIKVENRNPYNVPGFLDVTPKSTSLNHLFFTKEWKIAALRPYIRDLQDSAKKKGDPFHPLNNNVGWQQYFEDHSIGADYFNDLFLALQDRCKADSSPEAKENLTGKYVSLATWFEELVECLIRMESWLQHLQYACRLICGVGERPTLDKPAPSLFNVYNLRAAYLKYFSDNSSSSTPPVSSSEQGNQGEQIRYAYDSVCDALLDCLTAGDTAAKDEDAKREVEKRIQDLCRKRAEAMRQVLGSNGEQFSIVDCLNNAPPDWEFQKATNMVIEDLKSICEALEGVQKSMERKAEYELMSEEVEVRRISKVVRTILNGNGEEGKGHGVACPLPGSEGHSEPQATGCKAARALAAATMYADSFHQIDEKRLVFVASHVVHVLDNHLLYQSQQRRLDLDSDAFNLLGLEHFGLELMDTLHSCSQRIAHALGHLLKREAYRRGKSDLQMEIILPPLKEFVKEIIGTFGTSSTRDNGVSLVGLEYPVARVDDLAGKRVGTYVLEEIARTAELFLKEHSHGLGIGSVVPHSEDKATAITFLPNTNLGLDDAEFLAKVELLESTKDTGGDKKEKMSTLMRLKKEDLQKCDLSVLWSAVRVLEEVLRVTEATAGGIPNVTSA